MESTNKITDLIIKNRNTGGSTYFGSCTNIELVKDSLHFDMIFSTGLEVHHIVRLTNEYEVSFINGTQSSI